MNLPEYSDYFAGGIAFEYSTENANSMATSAYPFTTYGPQNYGLGYFSPEDCTDAGTNCTYERFPNFEFLAEAYTSYDSSNEPTLDSYKVPANHAETSPCPGNSPDLYSFLWESDSFESEVCPTRSESRLQCSVVTRISSENATTAVNAVSNTNSEAPATVSTSAVESSPTTSATNAPSDGSLAPATSSINALGHDGCRIR
ncbi:unnamed protein product [Phytophthora lilii]|uniref:Unnamed protein product n=1 Tax=Phytophthora lilii TaxID=2077276 RepID=A0A9W6U4L4_9STRA|nr:unnamed protein product [Phytophthora lilii]